MLCRPWVSVSPKLFGGYLAQENYELIIIWVFIIKYISLCYSVGVFSNFLSWPLWLDLGFYIFNFVQFIKPVLNFICLELFKTVQLSTFYICFHTLKIASRVCSWMLVFIGTLSLEALDNWVEDYSWEWRVVLAAFKS